MKKMAMAFAATFTLAVSCLPAMAATGTVSPNVWYDPEWEGVFHTSHSIHVQAPIHQQQHLRLNITA